MIEPKEINMYITTDGETFKSLTNARTHEAKLRFHELIENEFDTQTKVYDVVEEICTIIAENPETISAMLKSFLPIRDNERF